MKLSALIHSLELLQAATITDMEVELEIRKLASENFTVRLCVDAKTGTPYVALIGEV